MASDLTHYYTNIPLKGGIDLQVIFEPGEAEDESGLTPGEDDNEGWLKNYRKDIYISMGYSYYYDQLEIVKKFAAIARCEEEEAVWLTPSNDDNEAE